MSGRTDNAGGRPRRGARLLAGLCLVPAVLLAMLPATGCKREKPEPLPHIPWQRIPPPDLSARPPYDGPCEKRPSMKLKLYVNSELRREQENEALLQSPAAIVPASPAAMGRRSFPLDAFLAELPEARALEIVPCKGEPVRYEAGLLRENPGRFFLQQAGKGFLKLVDTGQSRGGGGPGLIRDLHAVRLVTEP